MHRWVSLWRGWGTGKGARGASNRHWGVGRVPFVPVRPKADNLLLIPTAGRDKTQNLFTFSNISQFMRGLNVSFREPCEWYHFEWYPPAALHHTDSLLITISTTRADPPVMRKLKPDGRCLGKRLTSDGKIVMPLPEMVTSLHLSLQSLLN